jgi:poly(A) polymerase
MARQRIEEDYLRILRFFRFHAAYGHDDPDAAGLAACIAARAGLDQLSRERVRMELMKLLVAPRAGPTLEVMAEAGLFTRVTGGVPYLAGFTRMAAVEASAGIAPDATQRLGGLAVAVPEDAERLWQRLRLTNAEHARLAAMGEHWRRMSPATGEAAARALLYRLKPVHFTDCALLAWARSEASAQDDAWRAFASLPQRWTAPVFPLKAADLMARGLDKGPALGAAMRAAEEAWIAAGFPNDAAALAAIADKAVASARQ